jgi:hypothetical protein
MTESEHLKESSRSATEKALQDQKVVFEEMIEQVKLCGLYILKFI